MLASSLQILAASAHELTLFAAVAFLLGGLSDTLIDLVWIVRGVWRHQFVFRTHKRADARSLTAASHPGRIAIFIPAWDESAVIAEMIDHAIATLRGADWVIYIGVYPNDRATIDAIAPFVSKQVRIVIGVRDGPTTKADCLNSVWQRLVLDERALGSEVKAIVLHDAEDIVHAAEPFVFDALIERFDLVQLPVLPLVDRNSRWIAGHYIDEFAAHHGASIVAREAIGAGLPSAGVGCAFSRTMLARIAEGRDGPFDAASLTEDYELGLRIRNLGGRSAFVRLPEAPGGALVCVRAHFPATLSTAVTQKARWIAGIALSGWDRLGWQGGVAERWMRLNDRRPVIAAVVMLAAYGALTLNAVTMLLDTTLGIPVAARRSSPFSTLLALCAFLLIWRLGLRAILVLRHYGWHEAARSVPRAFLANIIDMVAARRAVGIYLRARRDGVVRWDKTRHEFPVDPASAR